LRGTSKCAVLFQAILGMDKINEVKNMILNLWKLKFMYIIYKY
jgi:phosphotransferase system IIB component